MLADLGFASSKAEQGGKESRSPRLGGVRRAPPRSTSRCRSHDVQRYRSRRDRRLAGNRRDRPALRRAGAARVAIGYLRSDSAAAETAEEFGGARRRAVLIRGNISSDRVLEEVAQLGALDVLVHNAATGVIRPALETEDKHWDWTMTANTRALLALTRVAAPQMLPGASIVGISSLGSQRVLENYSLVGTSKAALETWSVPRGRAGTARDPCERRLGRRRRHGRARPLSQQGGDARLRQGQSRRPARLARGHRRGGDVFLCSPRRP